jgi:tetratricopeptide (TPR) repeat protein
VAGLAVVVVMLILGAMAFPLAAEAYAASSIPEDTRAVTGAGSPAPEETPVDSPTATPARNDLGVRPLPLLTSSARDEWIADQKDALDGAAGRVFGGNWVHVLETSEIALKTMMEAAYRTSRPNIEELLSNGELGDLNSLVIEAIESPAVSESSVVDLTGFLLLTRSETQADWRSLLAYAVAYQAARHFASCDSLLTWAHASTLSQGDNSVGTMGIGIQSIETAFDSATRACGDDITPQIERAYFHLRQVSSIGCWQSSSPLAWDAVLQEFKSIQASAPKNPAVWYGEADTYRVAANKLEPSGIQPFTVRAYREAAAAAYEKAVEATSASAPVVSLAKVRLELGDAGYALRILKGIRGTDDTTSSPDFLHLLSRAAAETGDYAQAMLVESQAIDTQLPNTPVLVPWDSPNRCFTSTELTGKNGANPVRYLGITQTGGPSLVSDFGFVPKWRSLIMYNSYGLENRLLEYRFLVRDWSDYTEVPANSREDQICAAFNARGNAGSMDNVTNEFVQNLWRRYGDLNAAVDAAENWVESWPNVAQAHERLGEILFLQERWAESAAASERAIAIYRTYGGLEDPYNAQGLYGLEAGGRGDVTTGPGWASLRQATALLNLGQIESAVPILEAAVEMERFVGEEDSEVALLNMYVQQNLGQAAYDSGDFENAISLMQYSIDLGASSVGAIGNVLRGVQAQVASVASLALGQSSDAVSFAKAAVDIDPYNPLFLETLAEAERAGLGQGAGSASPDVNSSADPKPESGLAPGGNSNIDRDTLIASYRAAIETDPTLFSAWNNLGILLTQVGRLDEAMTAFEEALIIRPDYALAWFNLGVAEGSRGGLRGFVRSQGALGQAANLDGALKGRSRSFAFDDEVYQSGVDVSKAIPVEWTLASTVRSGPTALTLSMVLLVTVRLAWTLASNQAVSGAIARVLGALRTGRPKLRRFLAAPLHGLWTTIVSLGALVAISGATGGSERIWCAVVATTLLASHALAPRLVRANGFIRQASCWPASVLTLGLAALGLGFAPPAPLADSDSTGPIPLFVRRSGVLVLGLVAVAFCGVAWLTAVPVARSSATAALLLVSSALLPVSPLDGARLGLGRWLELSITLTLGVGAGLLAVGLI